MKTNQLPSFSTVDPAKITNQLRELLDKNRSEMAGLLAQPGPYTWENLLRPLEDLEDRLHHFWSPINHLNAVMNTPELRKAYHDSLPLLSDYHTEIGHNQALYQAVCQIAAGAEFQRLDQAQQMVIKHALRDFKLAGIGLPPAEKKQFAELSKTLSKLSTRFEENVLDATEGWSKHITDQKDLSGIPETAVQAAKIAAQQKQMDGWLFTLDAPVYLAVMLHADSPALRQEMYTAYVTRASDQGPHAGRWDNTPLMQEILTNRLEKAHLLGFKNYAEQSLATKMVPSPHAALDFLNHLLDAVRPKALIEFQELQTFAQERDGAAALQPWDMGYYSEKLREQRYAISQEELRAYFPIDKVINGLFTIVNRLFGITVKPFDSADTWHPDVRCYEIRDATGALRSYFYVDLYARANKRGGAWMDEYCVRRRFADGKIQIPVAYLTCNFQAPVDHTPSLLTHDEVQTLFHEFGHCLQHMLTQVDYAAVSGINGIPWDAVEVASQFLENWAWEKDSIGYIAEHYQTRQPLPDALFTKMERAKNFQQAIQMLRQIEFSLFDFQLHLQFDPEQKNQIQKILDEVRELTALIPTPPFNRFQNTFAHIFSGGYGAGYYSYKWAEVMASDAFGLFLEKGIFDPETSQKFLHTFLESGGAADPLDLFIQFRGRPPQVEALLEQTGIL